MSIGRFSDYQVEQWLTELQKGMYLALHYDNPDIAGAYSSEVFGGGYHRQGCDFTFPSNRAMWNLNPVLYTGMPGVTVTHLAIWDQQVNGNYRAAIALDQAIRVLAGKQVGWGGTSIALSID